MAARPFHMGWFLGGGFSVHGWNDQWGGSSGRDWMKGGLILDLARALERSCFDYLLLEDSSFVPDDYGGSSEIYLKNALRVPKHDPLPLVPLLAEATDKLGLVPTISTSFYPPFLLARLIATLDYLSDGRVGCNLVTSTSSRAAQNYGLPAHIEHDTRYEMADEFIEVVRRLWDSWEPDAVVADGDTGTYVDHGKVHAIDFEGKFFKSRGPLNSMPPIQRHPVIAQAGGSPKGRALAAKNADTVLGSSRSVEEMKAFRDDIRRRAEESGRNPNDCKVLFLVNPLLGDTTGEARERDERRKRRADERLDISLAGLASLTEIDFSTFDLDAPLGAVATNGQQGTLAQFAREGEHLTLRELASSFSLSFSDLVGSPSDVASQMEEIMGEVGGDGFLISAGRINRRYISEITDGLMPVLQRRGLTRTEYSYNHFRQNLLEF